MNKTQIIFRILSIIITIFGVIGVIFSTYLAYDLTGGFRYNNWLVNGSDASSSIICMFSCIVCVCKGVYGIITKSATKNAGGYTALAIISFTYFLAACMLSGSDRRIMILSFFGVLFSVVYAINAIMIKQIANPKKEIK